MDSRIQNIKNKILDLLNDGVKTILSYDDITYFLRLDSSFSDEEINEGLDELEKEILIFKNKKDKYGLIHSILQNKHTAI